MLSNMDSLFNIADVFESLDKRQSGSDQDMDSFQESLGHTLSSHSLGGRSAFSWAPPLLEGPESDSSDDDEEAIDFGSIRSAVESMLDLDDKECNPLKAPYFTSLSCSPRGSLSTVASSARGSMSAQSPSRVSSMSRLFGQSNSVQHGEEGRPRSLQASPANSFRSMPHSKMQSPNRAPAPPAYTRMPRAAPTDFSRAFSGGAASDVISRQASDSFLSGTASPPVPDIMLSPTNAHRVAPAPAPGPSTAAPGVVDIDPRCLQSGGMITIGGQAYILMPAAAVLGSVTPPPQGSPRVMSPTTIAPPAPTGTLTPTYRPSPRTPSQRTRHISPTQQRMPPRPKATAANYPNIQVLSDKVDSTAEHGYYLSETIAAAAPATTPTPAPVSEVEPSVVTQPPPLPPQCFPTYTYDYGNNMDKGVWDILRKSMQKGPTAV